MISVSNIDKTYTVGKKSILALNDICLQIGKGELFGLIGPDGAGKTSLIRILTTLILPDKGNASVAGLDILKDFKKIRSKVGYMPGRFSLYQDLTVEENLQFFASIFETSIKENYDLIREIYVQLEPFKKRKAGQLSGGMKQKLALCCALIHKPSVLFLDEPTTGVDAVSRKEFWEMLQLLKNDGISILVSTPYMDEASLCDRVALINLGKIIALDKPASLVENEKDELWLIKSNSTYRLINDLRNFHGIQTVYPFGEFCHVTFSISSNEQYVHDYLISKGHAGIMIQRGKQSIEDIFMKKMA